MIEDSGDHDTDIKDFGIMWNILKKIKKPFYSLIGNHELRSMHSRKEIEQIIGYENAAFSIDLKGYHFVFLAPEVNTEVGTEDGGILRTQFFTTEDMKWLREDLQKNNLPCIVFSHFGIARENMDGNWWFEKNPTLAFWVNCEEIEDILNNDKNVLAAFCGHQHWTRETKKDGKYYYIIGSLTEDIHGDGIPDGVYFEVDLYENKVQVTVHNLRL